MFLFSTSYFGWFFIIAIDLVKLGGAGVCIGSGSWRGSLRAIVTKVSLLFASETLACFHEFCPLICADLPGPGTTQGCIHGIWISVSWLFPGCFPLFGCLGFLVYL